MITRTYSELRQLQTFEERFDYLKLGGSVSQDTFGFDRYINQSFYRSTEWRKVRNDVIARDLGRDLGVEGFDIHTKIIVHHMNPMVPRDIIDELDGILDPEFLITTSLNTHNAIHYGSNGTLILPDPERFPGDTKLW